MNRFAEWLSTTAPSVYIQNHNSWVIPGVQSIHIVGIAVVVGSVFMVALRILGLAGMDQTLRQTASRYGPWVKWSLWLLLVTGILMVVGEPVRELVTFSFWLKMFLVALSAVIATRFQTSLRKDEQQWEQKLVRKTSVHVVAIVTLMIWACIIVLGRLIAYDHIWGFVVAGNKGLMDIAALLKSLEATGIATRIRESLYLFPLLEATHVIALALVFGTIGIIDLRLLGLASSHRSFRKMASDILKWTWGAFALSVVTGALMFTTNAGVYYHNFYFRTKMVLLVLAGLNMGIFELTAGRTIHQWDKAPSAPSSGKAMGVLSIVLWIAIIFMGRLIGFTTTRAAVVTPAPGGVNFDDFLSGPGAAPAPPAPPAPKK